MCQFDLDMLQVLIYNIQTGPDVHTINTTTAITTTITTTTNPLLVIVMPWPTRGYGI